MPIVPPKHLRELLEDLANSVTVTGFETDMEAAKQRAAMTSQAKLDRSRDDRRRRELRKKLKKKKGKK